LLHIGYKEDIGYKEENKHIKFHDITHTPCKQIAYRQTTV